MKVVIVNWTGNKKHAGCILTGHAYYNLCNIYDMQIIRTVSCGIHSLEHLYADFEAADLLIVNGEGSTHHNNRPELIRIADRFPSVLINCVYEKNMPLKERDKFLYTAARESISARELNADDVVPDLVFSFDLKRFKPRKRKGKVVTDSCLVSTTKTLPFKNFPLAIIEQLSAAETVVTGRFHGAVLCMLLGIPFVTYESNTWKIDGLMLDAGCRMNHYQHLRDAEIAEVIPRRQEIADYVAKAKNKIHTMFKTIRELKP